MRKIFRFTVFFLLPFTISMSVNAQTEIAHKTYVYGQIPYLKDSGKVVLKFPSDKPNPKFEKEIIRDFIHDHYNIISWSTIFLPGVTYTQDETNQLIHENNIAHILILEITSEDINSYSTTSGVGSASVYNYTIAPMRPANHLPPVKQFPTLKPWA